MAANNDESTVKVKLWGIIIVFAAIAGWAVLAFANHERRIVTLETQWLSICEKLSDIRQDVKDIKTSLDKHTDLTRGSR